MASCFSNAFWGGSGSTRDCHPCESIYTTPLPLAPTPFVSPPNHKTNLLLPLAPELEFLPARELLLLFGRTEI